MNLTTNMTNGNASFPPDDSPDIQTGGGDTMINIATKMHWYSSAVCGTIFVVFGLLGNAVSIVIWNKKSMRSGSTAIYLIAQAINDLGVLIFFFITDSLVVMFPELKSSYSYGMFHSYVGYPLAYFFVVNSIWTTVGVTVDRYIQVCWYTHAKALCSSKNAYAGISLISVLCFLINTPHFTTYTPVQPGNDDPGQTAFKFTQFGQGKASQVYEFWVHCMFLVLVPWVTIFFFNMMILRTVYSVNRNMNNTRSEMARKNAKKSENQLTKILLSVTFCFLILIALQCITQCFFMMKPDLADRRIVDEAYAVAKLGVIINSSINFMLYCLSGECFRRELRLLFTRMFSCSDNQPPISLSNALTSSGPLPEARVNSKTPSVSSSFDSI